MTWSVIKQRLLVTCKGRGPCDNSERLAEPAVGGGAGVGGDRGPAQGGVEGEGLGQGGVGVEDEAGHAEAAGGGFQVGHQRAGGAPATGGGGDPEAFDLARRGIVAAEGAAADGVIAKPGQQEQAVGRAEIGGMGVGDMRGGGAGDQGLNQGEIGVETGAGVRRVGVAGGQGKGGHSGSLDQILAGCKHGAAGFGMQPGLLGAGFRARGALGDAGRKFIRAPEGRIRPRGDASDDCAS